jgi:predicted dienelactone hydrolase
MLTQLTFDRKCKRRQHWSAEMKPFALVAALILALATPAVAGGVGFQQRLIPGPQPITIGVWYPTRAEPRDTPLGLFTQTVAQGAEPDGRALPLVVMSHGTGGWYGEHFDTALALAQAGFVVAAVSHPHDTYDDQSHAAMVWERSGHLKRLIDYMLAEWPQHELLDPRRIGVFGFSSGGFTGLVAIGGVPDMGQTASHCQAHPDYYDCQLLKRSGRDPSSRASPPASWWIHDPRIRAAVIAAPALGYTFGKPGLAGVAIPVQLWRAERDHILPHPDYAEAVRLALPSPPEVHLASGADHFDFLAPCSAGLAQSAPDICKSPESFDRAAFHKAFNRQVVRFFKAKLR